jgi:NADH:ubiquinone oxidoreductase subunit 4 (subunit M)
MFSVLYLTLLVPLLGATLLAFLRPNLAYLFGIYTSILTFFVSIFLLIGFDPNFQGFQFYSSYVYSLSFGLDGLSLFFVLLTTAVFPICILSSTSVIYFNHKFFILMLLSIEFLLIASFSVLDLFLFFFFFESILVPMYMLIIV